jgi:hypothetical protein
MKRPAWLLGIVFAAALAHPLDAAACVAPQGVTDRPQCVEIVLRVPLDGAHPLQGTILARELRAADVQVSAVLEDLYRFHLPRAVSRALDAGRRVARLTQILLRSASVVLEHLAGDEPRAPRSC